jgi:hypothetical protein
MTRVGFLTRLLNRWRWRHRGLFYRRSDLSSPHVARFAHLLIGAICHAEERYDIASHALTGSGVVLAPLAHCNEPHRELLETRVSVFIDLVYEQISSDKNVHAAIATVLSNALTRHSDPAPTAHLTPLAVQNYLLCRDSEYVAAFVGSVLDAEGTALAFDECERRRAHVGECARCAGLVGAAKCACPSDPASYKLDQGRDRS